MQKTQSNIVIGKIVSHHGIRGELKIYPFTDDVTKFLRFEHLFIGSKKYIIDSCRIHKNMALVLFKGIDTIEKGLYLIGREVAVERAAVDDGEGHFVVDLIGLSVIDMDGNLLGKISDVIQNTSQDLYEVTRGGEIQSRGKKKTFLIPVVDEFVKEINIDGGGCSGIARRGTFGFIVGVFSEIQHFDAFSGSA